jgi:hypothetical protein
MMVARRPGGREHGPVRPVVRAVVAAVAAVSLGAAACTNPVDPSDTTAPEFVTVTLTLVRVTDGRSTGPLPAEGGRIVRNVERDRRIVVDATAGDPQSGVRSIELVGAEVGWTCQTPGDDRAEARRGSLDPNSDAVRDGSAAPGSPSVRSARFTHDPFEGNALRLVCPAADDASELTVRFKVRATNGNGRTTDTGEIAVVYRGRPAGPP